MFMKTVRVTLVVALALCASLWCVAQEAEAQQTPTRPGSTGPRVGGDTPRGEAGNRGREQERSREQARPQRRSVRRSGAADVSVVRGGGDERSIPRVSGVNEPFEAIRLNEVEYGDVPDVAANVKLSLVGPMNAVAFLDALSLATGWNIAATPAVQELMLQFWTKDISPKQAVAILKFNEIFYEYDADASFLFVMTLEEHFTRKYGRIIEHEFVIRYADLLDVETALVALLSSRGRLIADPATSKLLVLDTSDNVDHMARVVERLDQVQETRSFALVHADAEALLLSIEALLTESGQLSVDSRSNRLVVIDRPERLDQIAEVVAMFDRELETRSWTLDYADPVEVAENLYALVPEAMGSIVVNEAIHQITVTATPNRLSEIDQRVAAWDEKRSQVQIEAYLVTVGRAILRELGFNWSYMTTHDGDPVAVEFGTIGTPDGNGGIDLGALAGSQRLSFLSDDLSVVINSLDTSGDATILAHPRITVQDGAEAVFENTTQVPFASSTTTFGNNVGNQVNSNTQFEFIDVGTILRVTPRITRNQTVLLDISAEDSSFESVTIFANGQENTLPQKTQNKAETQVLVASGQTIVLGGLRTTNFLDTVDRVPILGSLPILGRLFRNTSKNHLDRELLIFLTPTVVGEGTQSEAARLAAIDDEIAGTMRSDANTALERIRDKINAGKRELTVTVGQSGGLLAEGEVVQLSELRRLIEETDNPERQTMIIREHPRAPGHVASQIAEFGMERGMKVKFDTTRFPFVPAPLENDG